LEKSGLHWQEKTLGQLFCDEKDSADLQKCGLLEI
jgi:predicted flavoprotein YhiN